MRHGTWPFAILAAACALGLGACSRHGTDNPDASGSPGTGNTAEVVKPVMPDSPAGGPDGISGSATHAGASGGTTVPGASGSGTVGTSQPPGTGLAGGLAAGSAGIANTLPGTASATSAPSGTGPDSAVLGGSGSSNSTTRGSVGNR